MISDSNSSTGRLRVWVGGVLIAALAVQVVAPAWAAVPAISTVPLATYSPDPPRSNLMFILDDSGSMARDFVPENTSGTAQYNGRCFGYYGLNKIFYNPAIFYQLPPKANFTEPITAASSYAQPSDYTKVPVDGFDTSAGTANLKNTPVWSSAGSGANATFYLSTSNFVGTVPATCTTTLSNAMTLVTTWAGVAALPAPKGPNNTTAKYPDGTTVTAQSNYAVWYAFYRTRTLVMRSAVGLVLRDLEASRFRVGFSTINYSGASDSSAEFQNIADFDKVTSGKSQRQRVLEKLYAVDPANSTPLRPALVKAGQYYANKVTDQTDPVQYSCQKNNTILTTDGYWNTASEPPNYKGQHFDKTPFTATDGDYGKATPYGDSYPYTLADIAAYYYDTDLRSDFSGTQSMTTYTLGLGVTGSLTYNSGYTDEGMKSVTWPDPKTLPLDTGNTVITRIDDLWHAAVNGHGRYYSAANPVEVVDSLRNALSKMATSQGSAAAANISSIAPAVGSEEQVFVPSAERSVTDNIPWRGDVRAYPLSIDKDGEVVLPDPGKDTPTWSAQKKLDDRVSPRKILFNRNGTLVDFNYTQLSTAGLNSYFDNRCLANAPADSKFTQCGTMTATALPNVTGSNLVEYLRGNTTYYQSSATSANQIFRTRKSILGDIVNSSPVFVGKPPFLYVDAGYGAYVEAQKSRSPRVYVGANDGMLHAFDAKTGEEVWAFVPTRAIPNLWYLADAAYDANHRAYVDGPMTLGDVYIDGAWRTVLVGGMGAGGKEYFAFDVTDPDSPKLLWEFTDTNDVNLGLTVGAPIVTKLKSGKWVAIFTSGYNNADGHGYLYVLDVATGALVSPAISTAKDDGGVPTQPSNLGKINAWIHADTDNTTRRVYGGDMLGNLWRFDIDDRIAPSGNEAFLIGQARDAAGKIQPITTRPMLTALGSRPKDDRTLVSFGTGKYLHQSDLSDEPPSSIYGNKQSIYAVKDEPNATPLGVLRNAGLVQRAAAVTSATLDLKTVKGFYMDLPESRERVNIDPMQFNGNLGFATSVPQTSDPCLGGGHSNLYYFGLKGEVTSIDQLDAIIVGGSRVFTPKSATEAGDGSKGGSHIWTTPKKPVKKKFDGNQGGASGKELRRASWRELME